MCELPEPWLTSGQFPAVGCTMLGRQCRNEALRKRAGLGDRRTGGRDNRRERQALQVSLQPYHLRSEVLGNHGW